MPTGITADIYKGEPVTLRQYILRCSRLMMPLVRFRDEPSDMEIPKQIEPENYNFERLEKFKGELEKLEKMTPEEIDRACEEDNEKRNREVDERNASEAQLKERYLAMQTKVRKWDVPENLSGLKRVALEQLDSSIRFDCGNLEKFSPLTPEQWHEKQLKDMRWNVKFYTEQCEKDVRNTAFINRWLNALHESLGEEE